MAKHTYKVTGPHPLVIEKQDIQPGAEFTATLSEDQERLLIDTGQIQVVTTKKKEV